MAMTFSRPAAGTGPGRPGRAGGGRRHGAAGVAALAVALVGCAPALDWRQMQPEGWTIGVALPCRPSQVVRSLPLAGAPVSMAMLSCSADDHLFAVAAADLGDPSRVGPALQAMGAAARGNLRATVQAEAPAGVPGMTPRAEARRWRLAGQRPDGQAVRMQVLVFAHGTRVYQATVLGPDADDARAGPLFDGLVVRP